MRKSGCCIGTKIRRSCLSKFSRFFDDERQTASLGEAGRKAVKTDWSGERFVTDIKNLYRQMLAGKRNNLDENFVKDLPSRLEENEIR